MVRVITYATKTANIIERESLDSEAKDYYLIFFATQIAICAFFLDTAHKFKLKKNKQSLLSS